MVRRRKPASDTTAATTRSKQPTAAQSSSDEPMTTTTTTESDTASQWSTQTQWIVFAIASGVCAALNGAFAKLTTTELTTSLSNGISNLVGLSEYKPIVEYVVRAVSINPPPPFTMVKSKLTTKNFFFFFGEQMFFILNLVFNGVMWSLFTTALARGTSATQVSIMNTSSNFIVTAMLGIAVFAEKLPPLWWAGAALLVVGNVITGRKNDGDEVVDADATVEAEPLIIREDDGAAQEVDESAYKDEEVDSDVLDIPVQ
ncbi:hypothetical protein MY3296_004514 [Beauveria thailandica]